MSQNIIERGRLSKLNDTSISNNVADGSALVFNTLTQKWEAKKITGGGEGTLGNPSDGNFDNGAAQLTEETKIVDAIDDLNEILGELVPQNASSLNGALTGSPAMKTAKVVTGLGENWTDYVGKQINNIVLTTTSTYGIKDAQFANADQGILKLHINGVVVAKIDLGANFKEENRKTQQNITDYNITGEGDEIANGVVSFANGKLKLVSVKKYGTFSKWQIGNVQVIIDQQLRDGKNDIKITHEIGKNIASTQTLTMCYDNITVSPQFTVQPTITEKIAIGKYLSGVKYYTTGDKFSVDYTVGDIFKTTYHPTAVSDYSMNGVNKKNGNPSNVPALDSTLVINDGEFTINANNVFSNNANLNVKVYDAYGTKKLDKTLSEKRLVLTYENQSTKVLEKFVDENYRLPKDYDFDNKTNPITGQWDSTTALENGNAQCYIKNSAPALIYPNVNFAEGFLPTNTANYSAGFSGDQVYIRAFESAGKGNAQFKFDGLSNLNDIKLEVKLPTQSGWGDALKPYDSSADKKQDGWGMLQGAASASGLTVTFGGLNTVDTNGRIYVRITLKNTNASLKGISVVGW